MPVIFDLDGTLADCRHRIPYIIGLDGKKLSKPDWPAFHAACVDDKPINKTIALLQMFYVVERIYIITGRNESVREATDKWLERYDIYPHKLIMRKKNDRRHDVVIKQEMLAEEGLTPSNVIGVFEDRSTVVRMYRDLGFTCYQVNDGDF